MCEATAPRVVAAALILLLLLAVAIRHRSDDDFTPVDKSKAVQHFAHRGVHKQKPPKAAPNAAPFHPLTRLDVVPATAWDDPAGAEFTWPIPIVLIAVGMQLHGMSKEALPFLCETNDLIYVLADQPQLHTGDAPCVRVVDIGPLVKRSAAEMPWPDGSPDVQHIFFTRWYVMRNWMRTTNHTRVMAIDADVLLFDNITQMVWDHRAEFEASDLWCGWFPPRATLALYITTLRALEDLCNFFDEFFAPANHIWLEKHHAPTAPNDMIIVGHYAHMAVGKPYPCWGWPTVKAGTCDGVIDYAQPDILESLTHEGIKAHYKPMSLTDFIPGYGFGDVNYKWDRVRQWDMSTGQKQVAFHRGVPHFLGKNGEWRKMWGYIMEDAMEDCTGNHVKRVHSKASCRCDNFCCAQCHSLSGNERFPSRERRLIRGR